MRRSNKRFRDCRWHAAFVAVMLMLLLPSHLAEAQNVLRIAAVVNDRVISALDVINRMKFVIWSTGVPNTPENHRRLSNQILRNLIDEEIQSQEAERVNVKVREKDVDNALADVARRNKMTAQKLSNILQRSGVAPSTLRRQLRVQIAWGRAISRRLRRDVKVSDDEIDGEIERAKELKNKPRFRVSEIFLSVDDPDQDEQTRLAAIRLVKQIREGADFAALASAFSQSTSAQSGGDLGWIQAGRLNRELDEALLNLKPQQVSKPIRTLSGYNILFLQDRREPENLGSGKVIVDLHQVVLPSGGGIADPAQKALADDIKAALTSCAELPALIKQIGTPESGPLGKVKLQELPPDLRTAVSGLKVGEASAPVVSAAGRTLILMVCDRIEPKKKRLSRSAIRKKLQQDRAELVARRYLRDLRRSAFVDLRG